MPVRLGGIRFESVPKARKYQLQLVRAHRQCATERGRAPYRSVVRHTHKDFPFLRDMFRHHPERTKKLWGRPLHHFEFTPISGNLKSAEGLWCCYVVNADGKRSRWSAKDIGVTKRKRIDAKLRTALRSEIAVQRDAFAAPFPKQVQCADCEAPLHNTHGSEGRATKAIRALPVAHVDHDVQQGKSFIDTYRAFVRRVPLERLTLTRDTRARYGTRILVLAHAQTRQQW